MPQYLTVEDVLNDPEKLKELVLATVLGIDWPEALRAYNRKLAAERRAQLQVVK